MRDNNQDVQKLHGCINDLISLMAMPAIWNGNDITKVAKTLLDVLLRILGLEFAYLRLKGDAQSPTTEICRIAKAPSSDKSESDITKILSSWLDNVNATETVSLPNPIGSGEIYAIHEPLGLDRKRGVVAVASRDPGFPNPIERLLFKSAINQVIIELQRHEVYAARCQMELAEQRRNQLQDENMNLRRQLQLEDKENKIVGLSLSLQKVMHHVNQVAPTKACVLIQGETGTGKELIARAIHHVSNRNQYPFITLNCAAIPDGLLEAELFGHEKGAFTHATGQRIGRFELANGGTIFLDEIGEIPLALQSKLLRVLQEQKFERLGSSHTTRVNVRLIAATNRDLNTMVAAGQFRSDLFYRLNVFPLLIPPLRKRKEDIPLLARHFTHQLAAEYNKSTLEISEKTMTALCRYHWPGNVRELGNFIERSVILSESAELEAPLAELEPNYEPDQEDMSLVDFERAHILKALQESNWVVAGPSGAAVKLGMKRTSLQYKMQKLGIKRPR